MGLAARLASRMYIFERGCFTTSGLDSVMQIINMGQTTKSQTKNTGMATSSIVLVENMSINSGIPNETLLHDLLSEEDGDETTNNIRGLVKQKFSIEFCKLPFCNGTESLEEHSKSVKRNLPNTKYRNVCRFTGKPYTF